jgi:hypothetical protein
MVYYNTLAVWIDIQWLFHLMGAGLSVLTLSNWLQVVQIIMSSLFSILVVLAILCKDSCAQRLHDFLTGVGRVL